MAVKNIPSSTQTASNVGRATESSASTKTSKAADTGIAGLPKPGSPTADGRSVDVAVSDRARTRAAEQKKALDLAMQAPDIREDRVAAIKAQIASGNYKVDSDKIADGMMREAIMEHLASNWNS